MSSSLAYLKKYLEYVVNAGGNATIATFDDDFEPIGPRLRFEMMPDFMEEIEGKLVVTAAGKLVLDQ